MKIALVYFEERLPAHRAHHTVNSRLLEGWIHFYKKSGTSFRPVLLMDKKTKKPWFWPYDVEVVEHCDPPTSRDVLNKVGWMKAQAFTLLGKCMIMDIDAFILKSLNLLDELSTPIAMAEDAARRKYPSWPEIVEEMNAGVMLFNSDLILPAFHRWWTAKEEEFAHVKYFDELVFSAITWELGGIKLGSHYNGSWAIENVSREESTRQMYQRYKDPETVVLHFHGRRKNQLGDFLAKHGTSETSLDRFIRRIRGHR